MQVYIAGAGKLATELKENLSARNGLIFCRWPDENKTNIKSIVVHAGSGRELGSITEFCTRTSSVLIELATGSALEGTNPAFPLVFCQNTNILMLKFMCMIERSGPMFSGYKIDITESHQAAKTSVPGTAVQMANSLGVPESDITSVRDVLKQENQLKIPHAYLTRHALHRIDLQEGSCVISMETRVFGESPYSSGLQQIIEAIRQINLQPRIYSINEFIENGWI